MHSTTALGTAPSNLLPRAVQPPRGSHHTSSRASQSESFAQHDGGSCPRTLTSCSSRRKQLHAMPMQRNARSPDRRSVQNRLNLILASAESQPRASACCRELRPCGDGLGQPPGWLSRLVRRATQGPRSSTPMHACWGAPPAGGCGVRSVAPMAACSVAPELRRGRRRSQGRGRDVAAGVDGSGAWAHRRRRQRQIGKDLRRQVHRRRFMLSSVATSLPAPRETRCCPSSYVFARMKPGRGQSPRKAATQAALASSRVRSGGTPSAPRGGVGSHSQSVCVCGSKRPPR